MEALETLQGQLGTLRELHTIVRTMKSLSSASIRQYEQAAEALAGYATTVELGLQAVLRDVAVPAVAIPPPTMPVGAIVFGSDHGLCGRFNEAIVDHALSQLETPSRCRWLAVGARAADGLADRGQVCEACLEMPGSAARITRTVQALLERVDAWEQQGVQRIVLFHHRRSGAELAGAVTLSLLPVDLHRYSRTEAPAWPSRRLPGFRMAPGVLLRRLVGQLLFVSLFRACAESLASEHASRRSAMQAAQRNLDERLDTLTQELRRARQALITAELLEVVGGFEVIAGAAQRPGPGGNAQGI
ncbi:F0F1 ATP synthase subunit gamma [Halomonas organivorans]|uniref:F-type H+-transporting ATPase subunit gamma n=1 Tax=Halomonas organivorans TaxID=257772 RepID=A0A7W5BU81_9GAMM|nr:F0F1 ATP synthase subunit gamma [Halomonas organivorans]MBB3139227.1 F-type H+-transporting ATPase subunit gamma [Halomonas organivorans]